MPGIRFIKIVGSKDQRRRRLTKFSIVIGLVYLRRAYPLLSDIIHIGPSRERKRKIRSLVRRASWL